MKIRMKYFVSGLTGILLLATTSFAQQDGETNIQQYVADYAIAWQDLPEWTEMHHEQTVPVLDSLVEAGTIEGWSAWEHHTGSEYNWRMIIDAREWDDFDNFWDGFFGAFSEEDFERSGNMIQAHRDLIWDTPEVEISESAESITWAYEGLYQINFSDMQAWNADWEEVVVPILEEAMANDILAGWVVNDHNTGYRFNRVQVFLFEEWDDIDDFWNMFIGGLTSNPDTWDRIGSMIQAHDDVIWHRVPRESGN